MNEDTKPADAPAPDAPVGPSYVTAAEMLPEQGPVTTAVPRRSQQVDSGLTRSYDLEVVPNSFAPVLIYAAFSVGSAVVAESALSFLGVGVKPDVPEWGNMIAAGQSSFDTQPWLTLFPSGAVVLTTLAFVFIGDGLRDALDPKLR